MNFKEYQKTSRETAIYPRRGKNFIYPTLGLVGEAGEIANKIKKIERDHNNIVSKETREAVRDELGDILWYIAQLATELKLSLDDIAELNIKKLFSRKKRGTLNGNGDNR